MVEVGRKLETPLKVSGMAARTGSVPFSTPFSVEVINAPTFGKVKMPNLELYNGTMDPDEHLGVYKTQIYIQDVDDIAHCQYFSATLKGVAQS